MDIDARIKALKDSQPTFDQDGHTVVKSWRHWGHGYDCRTHGGVGRSRDPSIAWSQMTSQCAANQEQK